VIVSEMPCWVSSVVKNHWKNEMTEKFVLYFEILFPDVKNIVSITPSWSVFFFLNNSDLKLHEEKGDVT